MDYSVYRKQYNQIVAIYCPPLKSHVKFTKEGWDHLVFKDPARGRTRNPRDVKMRLKHLHLVKKLLAKTSTIQEHRQTKEFTEIQINKRTEKQLLEVEDFGFIGILENARIKVIVRHNTKLDTYNFYSMTPYWKRTVKNGSCTRVYWDKEIY